MSNKNRIYLYFVFCITVPMLLLSLFGCGGAARRLKLDNPFTVSPSVIYRLDDAEKGAYVEILEEIIKVFEQNGVPLDVGVIPYAKGRSTYDMPYLKKYLEAGVIGLTVHAFEHIEWEFDTAHSGKGYEHLRSSLVMAREQIKEYYGVVPAAFSVPYDFFSKEGFRAIQDAGFKIFTTQKAVENHPSFIPVDYYGNKDKNGMYRLCTVGDVARWDNEKKQWGEILPPGGELKYSIMWGLDHLGVAVINVHPQSFLDKDNKIVPEKLTKLDAIIKWSRQFGKIITFNEWYKQAAGTALK
jgi:peptidoglycan/xylan/chitin deacetylase (PgdA/CDA1 family)